MRVGDITIGGMKVGIVTASHGDPDMDTPVSLMGNHPSGPGTPLGSHVPAMRSHTKHNSHSIRYGHHPKGSDELGTPSHLGKVSVGKGEDPRGMEPYIREEAKKNKVDPDIAVAVAKSEGLRDRVGDHGQSFGAFQLYKGGGLGNKFQKETGLDPADPANEKATISWALKNVGRTGWGPYHGAKRVGIGRREGIGVSSSAATSDSSELKLGSTSDATPLGPGIVTHHGTGRTPEPQVVRSMAYASAMAGVRTNIAHGDEGGHARHHHGASAGDIDLHDPTTGRKLDARYPEDRKKMESYIEHAAASGSTGIGFGQGGSYMGHSRMHVGGGKPAVWGAGGHGGNEPAWVRKAYSRGRANQVSPAQQQEVIAKAVKEVTTPHKEAAKPPEKESERLTPIVVDESNK